jgi:shikimate dehydrogenase
VTDHYGVIGHPIAHSKSPVIHRLFAEQTRQDIAYTAVDVLPELLVNSVQALLAEGWRGLNVTVPHKSAVAAVCTTLSARARAAGAVNTLVVQPDGSVEGDNTDGVGLLTDLRDNLKVSLQGQRVVILGAGGATRGILPALAGEQVQSITVANRSVERARELAREFSGLAPVVACGFHELGTEPGDLVVNATSAGLRGELPPFPAALLGPGTLAYDLSYAMQDTPFVAWAKAHGAGRVAQGWGMLVEQAAESFFRWRGVRPDTAPVIARLR